MKNKLFITMVVITLLAASSKADEKLGLVGIRTTAGRYLQAHTDGETHASNEHRNTEETWIIIAVDRTAHKYALQNWRNHKFLSLKVNGCPSANEESFVDAETWVLISGDAFGAPGKYAVKSAANGNYLGHKGPGDDIKECGGEVAAQSPANPPVNDPTWPGWWTIEGATTPTEGRDFWTALWEVGKEIGPVVAMALSSL